MQNHALVSQDVVIALNHIQYFAGACQRLHASLCTSVNETCHVLQLPPTDSNCGPSPLLYAMYAMQVVCKYRVLRLIDSCVPRGCDTYKTQSGRLYQGRGSAVRMPSAR